MNDIIPNWRAIFSLQSLCPDRLRTHSNVKQWYHLRGGRVTSLHCWSQECVEINLHCMVHHQIFLATLYMHSQLPSVCYIHRPVPLYSTILINQTVMNRIRKPQLKISTTPLTHDGPLIIGAWYSTNWPNVSRHRSQRRAGGLYLSDFRPSVVSDAVIGMAGRPQGNASNAILNSLFSHSVVFPFQLWTRGSIGSQFTSYCFMTYCVLRYDCRA